MRVTQPVTSLRCFMAAPRWPPILGSTGQIRTAEKAISLTVCEKEVGSISKQGSNFIINKQKSQIRKFRFSSTLSCTFRSQFSGLAPCKNL